MADMQLPAGLAERVGDFLDGHYPARTEPEAFLRARFGAGLAWIAYPRGHSGIGLHTGAQSAVDAVLAAAGAPADRSESNMIGLGMAAPTLHEVFLSEVRIPDTARIGTVGEGRKVAA
jgi:alkylation response protein AidB-like acyl-CoA dehydrogenase